MTLQFRVLLGNVLLAHLGTYMVVPLIPLYLLNVKQMSVPEIGMILAVSPFTFQAGSIAGGWLSDRLGRRLIIAAGAWLNAAAIAGYVWADSFPAFIGMGLLSGLGVGLNAPATKAAIAAIASNAERTRTSAFALRGIAANVGIAVAGLLTYYVLGGASALVFYVAAGFYAALGLLALLLLAGGCEDAPCRSTPIRAYARLFRNKPLIVFSAVSVMIWALYNQLALALPIRAERTLPDPNIVSLVWTMNSAAVIALQTPISRFVIDRIHPIQCLAIGMLFLGTGLSSLFWAETFAGLAVSGVVFVIGEMLIMPTIDATVSRMATAQTLGIMFALANVSSGIGEAAGKFVGGQLLGTGGDLVYFVYAGWAAAAIAGLLALRGWPAFSRAVGASVNPHAASSAAGAKADSTSRRQSDDAASRSFADWLLGRKDRGR